MTRSLVDRMPPSIPGPAIDAGGRWIAGSRFPDGDRPDLTLLDLEEMLARLERLTNLRAVANAEAPTGYRIEVDDAAYRGWARPW